MDSPLSTIRALAPLRRAIAAPDYDRAIELLQQVLPFVVHEYPAGEPHNGWVIPPRSNVIEAVLRRDGELVYDGLAHPLGVIALTAPFQGCLDREALRPHLHYHHDYSDAIPFHYRQQYRSWNRDWGFCVPRRLYDSLPPGEYEVSIRTEEEPGTLKVLTYDHRGELPATIAIGADLDRPGLANDGVSACAVGTEVMRRMRGRRTKFSYRLVLVPGTLGSEFYLGKMPATERSRLMTGVFLEMLGTPTRLALQHSRAGNTAMDAALARAVQQLSCDFRIGAFESLLVNDEHIWEAYGVSMCSLSRYPYSEYHSSLDNADAMDEHALDEAARVIELAIDELETTRLVTKLFTGTICCSNPKYNLYADPGEPVFGTAGGETTLRLRRLMDTIPTLDRPTTTRQLASQVELPEDEVIEYLTRWASKGLLRLD